MQLRPYFEWRGLGFISHSALSVREKYAQFDAELLFDVPGVRVADPKACQCGEVLKGVLKPWECKVFGTACTPETPIGTCMVSPEGGGKAPHPLIEAIFLDAFRNPLLEPLEDSASLRIGDARVALTTDSYVVSPLFFPGGDIGDLAINGTVNDLSVSGATPLYLSAGFILEEGFPVADPRRIADAVRAASRASA